MFAPGPWQMAYGERAALEGVLSQMEPALAVEIGTAEGGSLSRLASHCAEVHSFDLAPPSAESGALNNVIFHTGDSHELLPRTLAEFAAAKHSVDFVLVDGDHTTTGVRQDLVDLLASEAIGKSILLLHDTMNDGVRAGIESARLGDHPKVAYIDLDWVPGYLARDEPYKLELWGGLGLVVVDETRTFNAGGCVRQNRFHELVSIVRPARDLMRELDGQLDSFDVQNPADLERRLREAWSLPVDLAEIGGEGCTDQTAAELARCRQILEAMQSSWSWRLTEPLRLAKRLAHGLGRR